MGIASEITNRRNELGFTEDEVAKKVELSIYEYGDVEAYDDEALESLSLSKLKKLCEVLQLDIFTLFSIPQLDLNELQSWMRPRSEIVRHQRIKMGLSHEELGDRIGFFGYIVEEMEKEHQFFESWCLEEILNLSKEINVPPCVLIFDPRNSEQGVNSSS